MRTVLRRVVMAGLFLAWVSAASAQTADEIVEKHLAAIGGRQALLKLTSSTMAGTITLTTQVGDLSGTIEVVNEAPNKSRTLMKVDLSSLGAGTMTYDQRFDGQVGYIIDTLQGNRDITGDQLELMKNGSFPSPLLNYKATGASLAINGREKLGEREAYLLVLTPKSGPAVRQYVDAESYLPVRTVVRIDVPQFGELQQTTDLFDFRDVDGVKVPFGLKGTSAVQSYTVTLTNVEHNAKIDETVFSKP